MKTRSKKGVSNKRKIADSVSQDAALSALLMNGNRCVWLCGGSWSIGTMWHVYSLGDLGQWSTSGTSHNRVNTSTAIRRPTRQVGREKEARAKKTSGFSLTLSFSLSITHTHTCFGDFVLFCGICLNSFRCIWTQKRTEMGAYVQLWVVVGWIFNWQRWSRAFLVRSVKLILLVFFLPFVSSKSSSLILFVVYSLPCLAGVPCCDTAWKKKGCKAGKSNLQSCRGVIKETHQWTGRPHELSVQVVTHMGNERNRQTVYIVVVYSKTKVDLIYYSNDTVYVTHCVEFWCCEVFSTDSFLSLCSSQLF